METLTYLLTSQQAAKILKVKPREIARMVEKEQLQPAFKAPGLRGAYFFDPKEVEYTRARRELEKAA